MFDKDNILARIHVSFVALDRIDKEVEYADSFEEFCICIDICPWARVSNNFPNGRIYNKVDQFIKLLEKIHD